MENSVEAREYLQSLVGQKLNYAIKSPDTELYDFGFGEDREVNLYDGTKRTLPPYIIHVLCRFKMIFRDGSKKVRIFHEDTDSEAFKTKIQPLLGLAVKRVDLSGKNDLWLDFGEFWVVFATLEDEDESWRFFVSGSEDEPHLVATYRSLEFQ